MTAGVARVPTDSTQDAGPRLARWAYLAWDRTLNSVWFGIGLMVALALYVAVGSGFASLRAWLEMTDLEFFNWWPMRLLAGLLVANLLTVSMTRIPLTLPRLGVWCIHLGIIVLVFGMVRYFAHKTEGLTLVRLGETVDWYYDAAERALYATAGDRKARPIPLGDLPRFAEHEGGLSASLAGLAPEIFDYDPARRSGASVPLHAAVESEGEEPVTLDVEAYYPYAVVGRGYERGAGDLTGLQLTLDGGDRRWLVADQPGHDAGAAAAEQVARIRLRHLHRDDALTGKALLAAADRAHEVQWRVGGGQDVHDVEPQTVHLKPGGGRVPLGDSGYGVEAVAFLPDFPLSGTGEAVDALELLVHPPPGSPHGRTFRRYLLDGRHVETDFVLDAPGTGPKGERQPAPVDPDLHLHYALADGLDLLPRGSEDERHTVLTKAGGAGFDHLVARNDAPARLERVDDGRLELAINGEVIDPVTGAATPFSRPLDVERVDGLAHRTWVSVVPPAGRDEAEARAGVNQVASVRVRRGGWSEVVHVPFTQWPDQAPWQPASVRVPGLGVPLKLQLANTRLPMPARVTLDEFELVPYAGDFTAESAMRDFRSHLTVEQPGRDAAGATVKLNEPHYLTAEGGLMGPTSWLLFQNQWDPEDQAFTVLGVANRPGIHTMVAGCVMCVFGLMWAFYVKPALLRRRAAAALAKGNR